MSLRIAISVNQSVRWVLNYFLHSNTNAPGRLPSSTKKSFPKSDVKTGGLQVTLRHAQYHGWLRGNLCVFHWHVFTFFAAADCQFPWGLWRSTRVPAVLYLLELMQKLSTRSTTAVCFARATKLSEITSFKPEYTIHYAILYYTLPNKILYY